MTDAVHARLDLGLAASRLLADVPTLAPERLAGDICITVHEQMSAIEQDWRAFQDRADCTIFQTYAWLSCWQTHIGERTGVRPAIVIVRDAAGVLLMLPLATRAVGFARELCWLGSDLCDYNMPLLATDFPRRFDGAGFVALWARMAQCLQDHARHRFDLVNLVKMPDAVGGQRNPMLALGVVANPSGAYLTHLSGDWDTWYGAKRSSATRRRDRTKRKKLGEFGDVRMVNPQSAADIEAALDMLMTQKARLFARMGVGNLFARPGHADFYRALASEPATRALTHVSRLDVGSLPAAVNMGLIHRGRYYHLLASYDDGEVARFGPGAAHLHDLMHYAIDHGCDIFDFTIGDERYKRDWCDTELVLYDHIAPVTWRGTLIALPWLARQRLKRIIKQTPVLWTIFSKTRAALGAFKRRSNNPAED